MVTDHSPFLSNLHLGVNIESTRPNHTYATITGTSMATPHVAGVLALMMASFPGASSNDIVGALVKTVQPSISTGVSVGIVDALAAMEAIEEGHKYSLWEDGCVWADVVIQTDMYGYETGYRLRRKSDGALLWYGGSLKSWESYLESSCLPRGECYQFAIRDRYGDGIMGDSALLFSYNGAFLMEGGDFGRGDRVEFGDGC